MKLTDITSWDEGEKKNRECFEKDKERVNHYELSLGGVDHQRKILLIEEKTVKVNTRESVFAVSF
jgi:hypothetical protein